MPTINIASERSAFETQTGRFYRIVVGNRILRVLVCADSGAITEVRTGRRIGNVNDIKVERMCRISSYTKTSDRQAAEILIERTADRLGVDKFWAIVDAEPTVNA
jgi:hypothetical protein